MKFGSFKSFAKNIKNAKTATKHLPKSSSIKSGLKAGAKLGAKAAKWGAQNVLGPALQGAAYTAASNWASQATQPSQSEEAPAEGQGYRLAHGFGAPASMPIPFGGAIGKLYQAPHINYTPPNARKRLSIPRPQVNYQRPTAPSAPPEPTRLALPSTPMDAPRRTIPPKGPSLAQTLRKLQPIHPTIAKAMLPNTFDAIAGKKKKRGILSRIKGGLKSLGRKIKGGVKRLKSGAKRVYARAKEAKARAPEFARSVARDFKAKTAGLRAKASKLKAKYSKHISRIPMSNQALGKLAQSVKSRVRPRVREAIKKVKHRMGQAKAFLRERNRKGNFGFTRGKKFKKAKGMQPYVAGPLT